MTVELFVLCIKSMSFHNKLVFENGHTYIATKDGKNYIFTNDTHEKLPKHIFNIHFKVMFPVMNHMLD